MPDIPPEVRLKFSQLYETVEDVDLYPAGVSEPKIPGGQVGPTFACIIGHQFRNLRVGDRFWFENKDPVVEFSLDQLAEIRKFTLARLICDNLDHVNAIQPFVLLQPLSVALKQLGLGSVGEAYNLASLYRGENNERRPCAHIVIPNLTKWKEYK